MLWGFRGVKMTTFGRHADDAGTTRRRLLDDPPTTFGRRADDPGGQSAGGFRNVAGRFSAAGDGRSRRPSPCIDRGGLGLYLFRGLSTAGEPIQTVFGGRQFSLPIHSLPIQRYP